MLTQGEGHGSKWDSSSGGSKRNRVPINVDLNLVAPILTGTIYRFFCVASHSSAGTVERVYMHTSTTCYIFQYTFPPHTHFTKVGHTALSMLDLTTVYIVLFH